MKKFLIIAILLGSVAQADQASEKGRVDDCFSDASISMTDANEAQRMEEDQNQVAAKWARFNTKKNRCMKLKGEYVKKFGKYTMPKF